MTTRVFDFTDYKQFLNAVLPTQGEGRGRRSQIASLLGIQPAFVSQVLRGNLDFSLEQGARIADFLELSEEEQTFFVLLLQKARAGSNAIRRIFEKQIQAIRAKREMVTERVKPNRTLAAAEVARFYSRWYFAAIQVALYVPALRTEAKLAEHFHLPRATVVEVLQFLLKTGLIREESGSYLPQANRIHLPNTAQEIATHHTQWRLQAIRLLERNDSRAVNYSGAIALSRKNVELARQLLLQTIEQIEPLLAEDGEEEICLLNLDFVPL